MRQLTFDFDLAEPTSFAHFHISQANAVALAQLRMWLDADDPMPFYLWGAPSSGKSHLLAAASAHWAGRGLRVGAMDAQSLAADFDPRYSAIVLDDVHCYSPEQQARAFNWFINAMYPAHGGAPCRILCAGNAPAAQLALRDDLRSRLGWGHVVQLHTLDEADTRAALTARAAQLGWPLDNALLDYLLVHFSRDLGDLSKLIAQLDAFSREHKRPITVPLLKTMLKIDGDNGNVH